MFFVQFAVEVPWHDLDVSAGLYWKRQGATYYSQISTHGNIQSVGLALLIVLPPHVKFDVVPPAATKAEERTSDL